MVKHSINIVDSILLFNILEEIKSELSFSINYFEKTNDFFNYLSGEEIKNNNSLILTEFKNKNIFLNKNIHTKNILFLGVNNEEINDKLNYIKYPIDIFSLIEKINIFLIKKKYNNQSKIRIGKYNLDLNSKIISSINKNLKLTEKEMNIILFLDESKKPQKINVLQNQVWQYSADLETHTVETHVYRLRKKINDTFEDKNFILSTDNGYFIE